MKIACIYHSVDLDGKMSAAIVKKWFADQPAGNTLDLIGFNYGDPLPDLSRYDQVIMCDVSFPREIMKMLFDRLQDNFVYIDHHISAIKDQQDYVCPLGIRDTSFSACELTWRYFFPEEPMPVIVEVLGMYDTFRHKNTDRELSVLQFQYGARQAITTPEEALEHLNGPVYYLGMIQLAGEKIYAYLCEDAKVTYRNGFAVTLFEPHPAIVDLDGTPGNIARRFICINRERFNPISFGLDYHKDGYDGCACFHFDGKQWCFSLYNDNGRVDVSMIAKDYGGGGHKGASGFRLSNLNNFMDTTK